MRSLLRSFLSPIARGLLRLESVFRPQAKVPHQVLLLQYQVALGYCVHMTPVHQALSKAGFKVIVATRGVNLELLRHSPFVDELIETPDSMSDLRGAIRVLRDQLRLRGLNPDCCLTGSADRRTKIIALGALASKGWRGGFVVNPELYQRPLAYDATLSRMRNNLRIAELVGASVEGLEPRVFFSASDADRAAQLLAGAAGLAGTLAIIPCGSGGLPTAWIDERWAQVVRHASEQLGYGIVYLGTAGDRDKIGKIEALAGGIGRSLAGETTASELAALIANCDMVATIVTGVMHVARAVGTPMLVLAIAWEAPHQWLAQDREHIRILFGPQIETKPEGYCMEEISADRVTHELSDLQKHFPADATARTHRTDSNRSQTDLGEGLLKGTAQAEPLTDQARGS